MGLFSKMCNYASKLKLTLWLNPQVKPRRCHYRALPAEIDHCMNLCMHSLYSTEPWTKWHILIKYCYLTLFQSILSLLLHIILIVFFSFSSGYPPPLCSHNPLSCASCRCVWTGVRGVEMKEQQPVMNLPSVSHSPLRRLFPSFSDPNLMRQDSFSWSPHSRTPPPTFLLSSHRHSRAPPFYF